MRAHAPCPENGLLVGSGLPRPLVSRQVLQSDVMRQSETHSGLTGIWQKIIPPLTDCMCALRRLALLHWLDRPIIDPPTGKPAFADSVSGFGA
jgi:hypothetical protein